MMAARGFVTFSMSWAAVRLRPVSPLAVLSVWRVRRWYRAELRRLLDVGPYLIDDIGLGHREAVEESGKPFWRG